jgi:hypothetical protein
MGQAAQVVIRPCTAQEAVARLGALHELDPRKMAEPGDAPAISAGQAFVIEGQGVSACYVLQVKNGVAWCSAARGQAEGADLTAVLDGVMTAQAEGLQRLGMQTARPGLRRKLEKLGWRVTGWTMHKELTND